MLTTGLHLLRIAGGVEWCDVEEVDAVVERKLDCFQCSVLVRGLQEKSKRIRQLLMHAMHTMIIGQKRRLTP